MVTESERPACGTARQDYGRTNVLVDGQHGQQAARPAAAGADARVQGARLDPPDELRLTAAVRDDQAPQLVHGGHEDALRDRLGEQLGAGHDHGAQRGERHYLQHGGITVNEPVPGGLALQKDTVKGLGEAEGAPGRR